MLWGTVALLSVDSSCPLPSCPDPRRFPVGRAMRTEAKTEADNWTGGTFPQEQQSLGGIGGNRRRCQPLGWTCQASAPQAPCGVSSLDWLHPLRRDARRDATLAASGLAHQQQQQPPRAPIPSRLFLFPSRPRRIHSRLLHRESHAAPPLSSPTPRLLVES